MKDQQEYKEFTRAIIRLSRYTVFIAIIAVACIIVLVISLFTGRVPVSPATPALVINTNTSTQSPASAVIHKASISSSNTWSPPDDSTIPKGNNGRMIRYGRELIAHTADYFGPRGSIAHLANGMNCQNCHLDGGTKTYANNFAGVTANYPKFSPRSGKVASAALRIAECFERSLAGKVPDTAGHEVQAMLAYITWLGRGVKKESKLFGNASEKIPFMDHAADPLKGHNVFVAKCQSCHGKNGEGLLSAGKASYTYPPLWGKDSYNDGAGMYRIGNFAGFVKNNMPNGATYQRPQLSNEEAWDVAAFVNSQPRPHKDQRRDWPKINKKPIDFPFGPYEDKYAQTQHKFGPFKPIQNSQKLLEK